MTLDLLQHYDRRTIAMHWASAALVLFMWCSAHTIDWFPKGPLRVDVRSIHIVTGVILLCLIVLRIGWRVTEGLRIAEQSGLESIAKLVHLLL